MGGGAGPATHHRWADQLLLKEAADIDPISHALIGSAIAAVVPAGTHPAVVWGILIGAEMPDADFVLHYLGNETTYLKHHRGPTHGLVVLPAEAAVVAGVLRLIWPAAPFWHLFLGALLGGLSHVLSDFGNDYGTQGFWPFSGRRIAFDIIPIVDVWLLALLGGGWLVNGLVPGHRRVIFEGVWALAAAYVALRLLLRRRAAALVAGAFDLAEPLAEAPPHGSCWRGKRLTVHPTLFSLNAWHYVVQMPREFRLGTVWVWPGRVGRPQRAANAMDEVVLASLKSQVVSAFADWVRVPRVDVVQTDGLYQVRWTDMRYEIDDFSPFTAFAWLDQRLTLVDEGLGSQRPPAVGRQLLRRRLRKEMGIEDHEDPTTV